MNRVSRAGLAVVLSGALALALAPAAAQAAAPTFRPGAAGVGDPYYPLDGNGGYDVKHYELEVGDATFFRILKTWASQHKYGNVSTAQFTALAEKVSGRDLDDLFDAWLYTGAKPPGFEPPATLSKAAKKAQATTLAELKKRFGDGKG